MTDTQPQHSGADLARVALMAARQAAKTRPTNPREARRKRNASRRGDARDPIPLGGAITGLMESRAWETPAAGGSVIEQWPTIAPELAGKVTAERFHADRGVLDLRPASPAYGAQLRMFGQQMVDRINAKTGTQTVRAIRVLPPGSSARSVDTAPAAPSTQPAAEPPRVRTRDDASPGYHRALEAARAHKSSHPAVNPYIAEARARQEAALADPARREPETAFTDAVAAAEDAASSRGNDSDAVRQAAIQRARDEKAGRAPAVPTAFQRTA